MEIQKGWDRATKRFLKPKDNRKSEVKPQSHDFTGGCQNKNGRGQETNINKKKITS